MSSLISVCKTVSRSLPQYQVSLSLLQSLNKLHKLSRLLKGGQTCTVSPLAHNSGRLSANATRNVSENQVYSM